MPAQLVNCKCFLSGWKMRLVVLLLSSACVTAQKNGAQFDLGDLLGGLGGAKSGKKGVCGDNKVGTFPMRNSSLEIDEIRILKAAMSLAVSSADGEQTIQNRGKRLRTSRNANTREFRPLQML
eukprot:1018171-Prorocentrum_minimum.AAC.2